jgi:hypothetical protein
VSCLLIKCSGGISKGNLSLMWFFLKLGAS